MVGNGGGLSGSQAAGPDQPVALLHGEAGEMQFGRNGLPRTAVAAAILAKAQAMIGADDAFLFMKSGSAAPAVRADVAGDHHRL